MMDWQDFWEPHTFAYRLLKWGSVTLMILSGICLFLLNLDGIRAYEYACNNPVIVEAEKEVTGSLTSTAYEIYVNYSYGGVEYEHIYYDSYSSARNPDIIWGGENHIMVAIDPHNPGMPIRNMFSKAPVWISVPLWSLGLSMLIYGTALEFPKFRAWRVLCANRPSFLSRPYTKPNVDTDHPDYLKDAAFIWFPILFISTIILSLLFPYTFS